MASKKSFVMYQSWASAIEKMSDAQAGQLLKAIYALQDDPDATPDDPSLAFVFEIIKEKMVEDAEAYEEACRAKSEAGKKGNEARWGKKASQKVASVADAINQSQTSQKVANVADMKGYESDSDRHENINTPPNPPQRGKRFVPPTVEEVREYCKQSGHNVNPEEFVDFYSSKGWKVGSASMKDWKAAVRTWSRRKEKPQNSFHNFDQRENGGIGDMLRKKQIAAVMKGG